MLPMDRQLERVIEQHHDPRVEVLWEEQGREGPRREAAGEPSPIGRTITAPRPNGSGAQWSRWLRFTKPGLGGRGSLGFVTLRTLHDVTSENPDSPWGEFSSLYATEDKRL